MWYEFNKKKLTKFINFLLICLILFNSVPCAEADEPKPIQAKEVLEEIKENGVYENDHIIIENDLIISEPSLNHLTITNSRVNGKFKLCRGTMENDLNLCGTKFNSTVKFEKMDFKNDVKFINSTFNSSVHFNDVNIVNSAEFENSGFNSSVDFNNVNIGTKANFKNCNFSEEVSFNKFVISNAVFDLTTFQKGVDFSITDFNGNSKFNNAKFFGAVEFNKTHFNNGMIFDDSIFKQEANFNDVIFKGEDSDILSFDRTVFNDNLSFYAPILKKIASFDNAKINGYIIFSGPNGIINANFNNTGFSNDSHVIIRGDDIDIDKVNIDEKYIDTKNLSEKTFKQVLVQLTDQDKFYGKLYQEFNDNFSKPPEGFILKLFFYFNKYIIRWSTMDGVINVFSIFFILNLFVFPLFYLIRRCLTGPANNVEENSSLMNRIYDCYYFSITNVLSQRSGELKRRQCSCAALFQFILSAMLLFLVAYILANRWLLPQ